VFQQLEVDYALGRPNARFYRTDLKVAPIVRLYGVTEKGAPLRPCWQLGNCRDSATGSSDLDCQPGWVCLSAAMLAQCAVTCQSSYIGCRAGNSVCVFVHGFEPYFYVEAPLQQWTPDDSEELCKLLNVSRPLG
jgi:hypothetical protein